jgi:hypothetical protein
MRWYGVLTAAACLAGGAFSCGAAEYYVAPDGKVGNPGTKEAPWDMESALAAQQKKVQPGDTIWIRGGDYRYEKAYAPKASVAGWELKLAGTEEKPIIVRACKGERAKFDPGVSVVAGANYVWLWDLEIAPVKDMPEDYYVSNKAGSLEAELNGPRGGLGMNAGKGCKYINLFIHHNLGGGVGWWTPATDNEMYGCVITDNGWKGAKGTNDRNHGHSIYTQNKDGIKTLSNCILTTRWGGGQLTLQAYGSSKADCDNFLIEDNIAYERGPKPDSQFLIGSGKPSHNIRILHNYLYNVPMQIGYGAANVDCQISENVVANSSIGIRKYEKVVAEKNVIVNGGINFTECKDVQNKDNEVLKAAPAEPKVVLLVNKYDPNRANLAIYNWQKAKVVDVPVGDFLKVGDSFKLMNPPDLLGKPVLEGKCEGKTVKVPMEGEFGVFVVMKVQN